MLRLSGVFLAIATISAIFGFGLLGDYNSDAAKIVFFVSLFLAVLSFLADAFSGRSIDPI